jgi:hypothetical protein
LADNEALALDLILFLGEEVSVLINARGDFFDDLLLSKFCFSQFIDLALELLVRSNNMIIRVDGLVQLPF